MSTDDIRYRNNKINTEWTYAKDCWGALVNGTEVPPVPKYTTWMIKGNVETTHGTHLITPRQVSYGGVTLYPMSERQK